MTSFGGIRPIRISRRQFIGKLGGMVIGCGALTVLPGCRKPGADLISSIAVEIPWNGRQQGKSWFHPRACIIPNPDSPAQPIVFMTLQEISGSDVFGQVHWTMTADLGKSWREPEPIAAFARRDVGAGLEEGVCDVVPQFHPQSGTILAMGHNVYYSEGRLTKPSEDRFPVYAVRTPEGKWSERMKLEWSDPRGSGIYTCGCAERILLDDGDILVPISFGPKDRANRSVTSFLCSFDGAELIVKQVGNELINIVGRGLLEPSLVRWNSEYLMTIRAEDDRGYVSRSADGLNWSEPRPWRFEDGEPLIMSTTQQHWLPHSERLHLVYTRRTEQNAKVVRWRAPLFVAAVDIENLRIIRASEKVVFPLRGDPLNHADHVARMGNFHPLAVTPRESWVTVGEARPEDGWKGDLLLARLRWSRPNKII
jgi:hypothetical protein